MSAFSSVASLNPLQNGFLPTIPITTQLHHMKTRNPPLIVLSNKMNKFRRALNISILTILVSISFSSFVIAIDDVLELERYTDSAKGFTLLRSSLWIKVDKTGATAIFKDGNKGYNNVDVVVIPVKITTLSQFRNPQFMADKLILAKKRKESTKEAEVISVSERTRDKGLQVYEFEYRVDSTRRVFKRILSATFVTFGKHHLLTLMV